MRGFDFNWLRAPAGREVIARRTRPDGGAGHALELTQPSDPERFTFLVVGDTGDAGPGGEALSPVDAVAGELAADAALPETGGTGILVLHVGDVVYMAGERRLYDRNFRRPYAPFLTPQATVDDLVFRLPFLPVPGNHDYYDFARWARALVRVPALGAGLRAVARELFAFNVPGGGSDMGRAYMEAFVAAGAPERAPLVYRPGSATRLPNRYFRFRAGSVDFFALDSNTLQAPPPRAVPAAVRAGASRRVAELRRKAGALDRQLRRDEEALERWRARDREALAADADRIRGRLARTRLLSGALTELDSALRERPGAPCAAAARAFHGLRTRWQALERALADAASLDAAAAALRKQDAAVESAAAALGAVEECVASAPGGPDDGRLEAARSRFREALRSWREDVSGSPPPELQARLHALAESALDAQRELARELRGARYRPEDHDRAQIEWLETGLTEAERQRPDGWRVVYLHHPLYTSISNYCEHGDVVGVRENLVEILRGRAHVVFSGHAHAFEWLRTAGLPETGLVVTGGGGQVSLRGSVLDPRRWERYRARARALQRAGVTECACAGRGPEAMDGEAGPLYHYVRVEVSPEAMRVCPVGVRRVAGGFRRETPMRVYHAPALPEGPEQPAWQVRELAAIEIRRGRAPEPEWL